eukprot:765176-Hanusia_phi.AAC.1
MDSESPPPLSDRGEERREEEEEEEGRVSPGILSHLKLVGMDRSAEAKVPNNAVSRNTNSILQSLLLNR